MRPKGFAKFSTELKNPHFKVDSGAYPNPGQSSEVNIEFLDFIAAFPVGPFMFTISKYIFCYSVLVVMLKFYVLFVLLFYFIFSFFFLSFFQIFLCSLLFVIVLSCCGLS